MARLPLVVILMRVGRPNSFRTVVQCAPFLRCYG